MDTLVSGAYGETWLSSGCVVQTYALDFGPQGSADVTANVLEAVPCGAVLHEDATPEPGNPLVLVQLPHQSVHDDVSQKASLTRYQTGLST